MSCIIGPMTPNLLLLLLLLFRVLFAFVYIDSCCEYHYYIIICVADVYG